jgi:hypothetical protein
MAPQPAMDRARPAGTSMAGESSYLSSLQGWLDFLDRKPRIAARLAAALNRERADLSAEPAELDDVIAKVSEVRVKPRVASRPARAALVAALMSGWSCAGVGSDLRPENGVRNR